MAESTATPPGRIFISYRREETAYPAAWLFDRLRDHFDEDQIFKDVDSIELGDDFVEVIIDAVGSCDVLLAVIGDRWLTITDEDGKRRLDNPDDFVRLEIEAALAREVRVVPILIDGAPMPRPEELPPSLAKLVRRQALELSPVRFDVDTGRLVRVLEKTLAEVQSRSPAQGSKADVPIRKTAQHSETHHWQYRGSESRRKVPSRPPPGPQRMVRLGLLAGASLVAVLVAVALTVMLSRDSDGARDVLVDGKQPWTDSHIDLKAGNNVQITARGEVFHSENSSLGPEGFPNRPELLTPLDTANHAGLLARVGTTGTPFYVGRRTAFTADRDGRLFLGINDGGLENNRGSFTATVTVSSD